MNESLCIKPEGGHSRSERRPIKSCWNLFGTRTRNIPGTHHLLDVHSSSIHQPCTYIIYIYYLIYKYIYYILYIYIYNIYIHIRIKKKSRCNMWDLAQNGRTLYSDVGLDFQSGSERGNSRARIPRQGLRPFPEQCSDEKANRVEFWGGVLTWTVVPSHFAESRAHSSSATLPSCSPPLPVSRHPLR